MQRHTRHEKLPRKGLLSMGLIQYQEIVEIKVRNVVGSSVKDAIDAMLAQKPLHRIVSMSMTSSEEFNTAAVVLLVIEYLDPSTS